MQALATTTAYGEVFTRRWVVDVLLDLAGYTPDRDLASLTILEPSIGRGAFILPIVERLVDSIEASGQPLSACGSAVRGYDLQPENIQHCREALRELLEGRGHPRDVVERLTMDWLSVGDFLLVDEPTSADVVVGNPPYIRIEDLDPATSAEYRRRWPTMSGRADIYIGFFERSLGVLKPEGRLAFICADRWMRNQYGSRLRRLVADSYAVDAVWTMHDVDAFENQVSAYPAITVLRNGEQAHAVVASTDSSFSSSSARDLAKWTLNDDASELGGLGFDAHRLPHWFPGTGMWPSGDPARLALIEHLADRFPTLHSPETGTRVGIGVATGADRVYVIDDPDLVEPDRALPLAMGRDLTSGTFDWGGKYLANPWTEDGSLVDLGSYPKLKTYLETAGPQLRSRHTAKKNLDRWHRTIDKVNAALTDRPKLLLRDLGARANPVLEPGGCYPHHNVYYVVSDEWDLEVLGGLLLSRVAQAFIESYGVRMRGGTLRFQAQYLKQIRVPRPDEVSPPTEDALRSAFRSRDASAATRAAADAYGLDLERFGLTPEDA